MEGIFAYIIMIWALLLSRTLGIVPHFLHCFIDTFSAIYLGSVYSLHYIKRSKAQKTPILVRSFYMYPLCSTAILVASNFAIIYIGMPMTNTFMLLYFSILGVFTMKNWTDCIFHYSYINSYASYGISLIVVLVYYFTKDITLNNIIGISFCIFAMNRFFLCKFQRIVIMMLLYVLYDVYFVFYSDIMNSLAGSIDAPIKLMYIFAKSRHYLGLGDVMIPGAIISFCARIDKKLPKGHYFFASFMGYIIGYIMSITASLILERGIPALLYLIPCTLIAIVIQALLKGQFKQILAVDEEIDFVAKKQ